MRNGIIVCRLSLIKTYLLAFHVLRKFRDSAPLTMCKNGELSENQIGRNGVQGKKEKEKFTVMCSRSPQNLEFGHFTLLFC